MATPVVTGHGAKGRRFFLWRGMTHGIAVVLKPTLRRAYGPPPARPRRSPASRYRRYRHIAAIGAARGTLALDAATFLISPSQSALDGRPVPRMRYYG